MKQAIIMSKINGVVIKATYSRKNTPELSYSSKCNYCDNDFLHSRNTAKYFDHVVYCEVKNRKHSFASSTTYAGNILTGSRTDIALEADATPSLLRIFTGSNQKGGDRSDPATPSSAVEPTSGQKAVGLLEKYRATKGK